VVVVVPADEHVLVGRLGAGDDPDDVGALGEGLEVRRRAGLAGHRADGDLLQLLDQPGPRRDATGRVVVAPGEGVRRQVAHVGVEATGQRRSARTHGDGAPERSDGRHGFPFGRGPVGGGP